MHLNLSNENMLYVVGAMILVFLFFSVACYIVDRMNWNKGKCLCGEPWYNFDTDSQGGRGYSCRKCGKTIWISYPVDKRKQ